MTVIWLIILAIPCVSAYYEDSDFDEEGVTKEFLSFDVDDRQIRYAELVVATHGCKIDRLENVIAFMKEDLPTFNDVQLKFRDMTPRIYFNNQNDEPVERVIIYSKMPFEVRRELIVRGFLRVADHPDGSRVYYTQDFDNRESVPVPYPINPRYKRRDQLPDGIWKW
ncbi:uncharacterized protein LOC128230524 [Mya arenaria]|uniref:uncharacterized protein LOC128230524 n=1 Tax=Mya arenaria TaxID=6604 RepID=UPI0022E66B52|nr:uncharacterized protein LOC128230524 [Mya arenaria]